MSELLIDFITSLEGNGAAEGWPGWWGLEGPEYLAWLGDQPEADYTVLMGANTYRLMSELVGEGEPGTDALTGLTKVVFSSTLSEPLSWERRVAGQAGSRRDRAQDEGRRHHVAAHHRQPHALPLAPESWPRRSLPRRRVPGHHRTHRQVGGSTTDTRTSPSTWSKAARSTDGCSCSSTYPRYWPGCLVPARTTPRVGSRVASSRAGTSVRRRLVAEALEGTAVWAALQTSGRR